MKKKGQALLEFVIILPVFLMLVLGVFDIGNIFISKIALEDKVNEVVKLYNSGKDITYIKEKLDIESEVYKLEIESSGEYIDILLEKKIEIITPGLNLILKNPFIVDIKRSISNG